MTETLPKISNYSNLEGYSAGNNIFIGTHSELISQYKELVCMRMNYACNLNIHKIEFRFD